MRCKKCGKYSATNSPACHCRVKVSQEQNRVYMITKSEELAHIEDVPRSIPINAKFGLAPVGYFSIS